LAGKSNVMCRFTTWTCSKSPLQRLVLMISRNSQHDACGQLKQLSFDGGVDVCLATVDRSLAAKATAPSSIDRTSTPTTMMQRARAVALTCYASNRSGTVTALLRAMFSRHIVMIVLTLIRTTHRTSKGRTCKKATGQRSSATNC